MTMAAPSTTNTSPAPSRMALGAIRRGAVRAPLRTVLYGVEGIGKTTFAAGAPSPVFLGAEDGFGVLDVPRFPAPTSWAEVGEALTELERGEHEYRTLVLDTLDWLEPLLNADLERRYKGFSDLRYGKDSVLAVDEGWRPFLRRLETLASTRRMDLVLLAHAKVEEFAPPDGDPYQRYTLKIRRAAAALAKEWADCLAFAQWSGVQVLRDPANQRAKGRAVGEKTRTLHTSSRSGAFEAKNRYGLPEELPLEWHPFAEAIDCAFDAPKLHAELLALASEAPPEIADTARAYADANRQNAASLLAAIERLRARIAAAQPTATPTDTKD